MWWKRLDADLAARFEQLLRSPGVRAEEAARVEHRQAVVRLGREVDDGVDAVLHQQGLDRRTVGDVELCERDRVLEVGQIRSGARVGQGVERDDVVAGMVFGPPATEVRADEAGAAGHDDSLAHARHVDPVRSSSSRLGLAWSRSDSTGCSTPQSAPIAGSSQATPNSSAGS